MTERRLTAILNADVVGYSRLMAEDEAATIRTITAYRNEITALVGEHHGRVVDAPGDELLAEFPTAQDAVEAGVEIQRVIQARNAGLPEGRRMEFRIGIHLGDVTVEGERIYGNGVNIAARLQGLAEPGGVCLSGTVLDLVAARLEGKAEDLGEQSLKNIPQTIRVFRLRPQVPPQAAAPGGDGHPAIAVLPFDNLSADVDQEYFADGIAEDLITRLSAWRQFPVISRNSSFVYKGSAVDLKKLSHELGVRYVVEGSVRRAGDRVRISAQLIDATSDHHLWAEHYDRDLRDVFALQDEITEAIVGAMHPALQRAETERALRRDPQSLDAWECLQRGRWHARRLTREDMAKSRELFERAIELDPRFALAYAGLSHTHYWEVLSQLTDSPEEHARAALEAARKAVALDGAVAFCHIALGHAYSLTGQQDEQLAEFELATRLDPSDPQALFSLGLFLALAGRPDEAIPNVEHAIRLSPRDPMMAEFNYAIAVAHFAATRYEEAIRASRLSLQHRRSHASALRYLAASCAHLGRLDEARAALEEMHRAVSGFDLHEFRRVYASADPELTARLFEGLRRAGLED